MINFENTGYKTNGSELHLQRIIVYENTGLLLVMHITCVKYGVWILYVIRRKKSWLWVDTIDHKSGNAFPLSILVYTICFHIYIYISPYVGITYSLLLLKIYISFIYSGIRFIIISLKILFGVYRTRNIQFLVLKVFLFINMYVDIEVKTSCIKKVFFHFVTTLSISLQVWYGHCNYDWYNQTTPVFIHFLPFIKFKLKEANTNLFINYIKLYLSEHINYAEFMFWLVK